MCVSGRRRYAANAAAPAAARTFGHAIIVAVLEPSGWSLADDMEVLISELATGALNDTGETIDVAIDVHYDHLRITLTHTGAAAEGTQHPLAAAPELREAVLGVLATKIFTEIDACGRSRTVAQVDCDPRHTTTLHCKFRPS